MMRLRKISIRNVRKFISPVLISGLTDGLNIITGDNEDGKSTILQAIRAALCTKYSVTGKELQGLQPYNSAAIPEIGLDFEIGTESYNLKKCFGKKGTAELRTANSVFNGSEVEEQLQKLCFTGSSEKSKEIAQSNIWSVLWVDQGTAFSAPEIGQLGHKTLQTALEGELGKIVGGDDGQLILRNVREMYLQWYTPTGREKEKGEYKAAVEQREKIESAYIESKQKFDAFEKQLQQLDETRSALRKHDESRSLAVAKEKYEAALLKQKAVETKRMDLQRAEQAEKTETVEYKSVSESFRLRTEIIAELERAIKRTDENREKSQQLQTQHAETCNLLHAAQQDYEEKDQLNAAAVLEFDQCEQIAAFVQLKQSKQHADTTLVQARESSAKALAILEQVKAIKVDRSLIDNLRSLDRQLLQAETQLSASATQVEFKPIAANKVSNQGQVIDTSAPILLTDETIFDLKTWGQLHVRPGGGELKKLKASADDRKKAFTAALSTAAVKNIQEAEELERKKTSLESSYKVLQNDLLKYAPTGIAALESECARLASQLAEIITKIGTNAEDHALKTLEEAKSALEVVRIKRDLARSALSTADQTMKKATAAFALIDGSVKELATQAKSLFEEQQRLSEKLEKERLKENDTTLNQRVTEAGIKYARASEARAGLQMSLETDSASTIDAEVKSLHQDIEQLQGQLQTLRESQIRLSTALQEQGSAGIAEEVEKLSGKLEQCRSTEIKTRKTSLAIKLLHDTLTEAERSSKAQLAGPLLRHLEPLVHELFNDGKLILNSSSFSISEFTRSAANEPYEQLSVGTREQLSVLTRLAFARVLAESNTPALVILDDALVYSDQLRLAKMQQTLLKASRDVQIIILTCRERDYAGLDANFINLSSCGSALLV